MNTPDSIQANIAARKEREAREAQEREENFGRTLAEIEADRVADARARARLLARQHSRSGKYTSGHGIDRAIRALNAMLASLPQPAPMTPEQKAQQAADRAEQRRLARLQDAAEQRLLDLTGKGKKV